MNDSRPARSAQEIARTIELVGVGDGGGWWRSFRTTVRLCAGYRRLAVAHNPPRTPLAPVFGAGSSVKPPVRSAIQADPAFDLQGKAPGPPISFSPLPGDKTRPWATSWHQLRSATSMPGLVENLAPDAPGPPGSSCRAAGDWATSRGHKMEIKACFGAMARVVPTLGRAGWRFQWVS